LIETLADKEKVHTFAPAIGYNDIDFKHESLENRSVFKATQKFFERLRK